MGATYLNAHHSNTLLESFIGSRFRGDLTVDQKRHRHQSESKSYSKDGLA